MPLFFSWDAHFKDVMTGAGSSSSVKQSHASREKLFAIMSSYLHQHLTETAPWIHRQMEKMMALGCSWDFTVRVVALKLLWASAANLAPVSTWAAAFVYRDPVITSRLRDELASADSSVPLDKSSPSAQFVAEETNRLTMFASIVRPVVGKDTWIPTSKGDQLYVRKGDLILGQCWEVHREFDQPEKFIFDRVEKARQAGKTDIGYIPFGGGKGMVRSLLILLWKSI
jgi:hypothetical protein